MLTEIKFKKEKNQKLMMYYITLKIKNNKTNKEDSLSLGAAPGIETHLHSRSATRFQKRSGL